MTDAEDPPVEPWRSDLMRRVATRGSKPEMIVRRALHALGFRFRLHRRDLPGSPDIVLPRRRTAIFVHGCFWHRHAGCKRTTTPKTRAAFWEAKFEANVVRDRRVIAALERDGWTVEVVWECETSDPERLASRLRTLARPGPAAEPGHDLAWRGG